MFSGDTTPLPRVMNNTTILIHEVVVDVCGVV